MEGQQNSAVPQAVNDQAGGSKMDFAVLGKQALEQMEKTPLFTEDGQEEAKAADVTAEPVTPNSADTPAQTAEPAVKESDTTQSDILKLANDAKLEVLVDGKPQVITVSEYKAGIQREAVFTKRMQTLAEQRKQVEAELAQAAAQIQQEALALQRQQQMLQQNNPLAQLQQLIEQQQAQPQQDPNSIATIGELQQMVKQLQEGQQSALKEQEQKFMQTLEHANRELQERAQDARDANRYTTALVDTLAQDDAKVIQGQFLDPTEAEAFVRFNVAKMNPQSIDEAIAFTKQYVKGWAQHIRGQKQEQSKQTEVKKAQAVLEPSNGTSPAAVTSGQARSQSFLDKDGKIDYKTLRERANALLG